MAAALGSGEKKHIPRTPSVDSKLCYSDRDASSASILTNSTSPMPRTRSVDGLSRRDSKGSSSLRSPKHDNSVPAHQFQVHSDDACHSGCYLQTRYVSGEWPFDEVKYFSALLKNDRNIFRQAVFSLMKSENQQLSFSATCLFDLIVSNKHIDRSLLKEANLVPHRTLRMKDPLSPVVASEINSKHQTSQANLIFGAHSNELISKQKNVPLHNTQDIVDVNNITIENNLAMGMHEENEFDSSEDDESNDGSTDDDGDRVNAEEYIEISKNSQPEVVVVEEVLNVSVVPVETSQDITRRESRKPMQIDTSLGTASPRNSSFARYNKPSVDILLEKLLQSDTMRLINTRMAIQLFLELVSDTRNHTVVSLTEEHIDAIRRIYARSIEVVVESRKGEVETMESFIYVLEDEVLAFNRLAFPMGKHDTKNLTVLGLATPVPTSIGLHTRSCEADIVLPSTDLGNCKKAINVFFLMRKLTIRLGLSTEGESLEVQLLERYKDPKTKHFLSVHAAYELVLLQEQSFLPCTLGRPFDGLNVTSEYYFLLNADIFLLVEPDATQIGYGSIKRLASLHRVICVVDGKSALGLHVVVYESLPPGFGNSNKISVQDLGLDDKKHIAKCYRLHLIFQSEEMCLQAKSHIESCHTIQMAQKMAYVETLLAVEEYEI